jgi:uncharacterized Zn finger protein
MTIKYICQKCGPLAVLQEVNGPFDMKITCRICGGFGIPVHDFKKPQKMNIQNSEQIINACTLRGG